MTLRLHTIQDHPDFTEIHLRLRTRGMLLRDEYFNPAAGLHIDLSPTDPHIVTHGRIRQLLRPALLNEPGQNPAGSMALLPWRRRILGQHGIDRRLERLQPPGHALSWFAFGRGSRFQSLSHSPSVNPVPSR
jgi:hypothetical protein